MPKGSQPLNHLNENKINSPRKAERNAMRPRFRGIFVAHQPPVVAASSTTDDQGSSQAKSHNAAEMVTPRNHRPGASHEARTQQNPTQISANKGSKIQRFLRAMARRVWMELARMVSETEN